MAHIPTMLLCTALASWIMAASIIIVAWDRRMPGFRIWSVGLIVHGVAYFLLLLRGMVPDMVSIVFANASLSATLALMRQAFCEFHGRKSQAWQTFGPTALVVLLFIVFLDNVSARLIVGGFLFTLQTAMIIRESMSTGAHPSGRGHYLIVLTGTVVAMVFLSRALSVFLVPDSTSALFAPNPVQTVTFAAGMFAVISLSIGFLLMSNERSEHDNHQLAMLDGLTGVYNRRAVLDVLESEVARSKRNGTSLALIMLDMDHFKQINDSLGHIAGDQVLASSIQRIQGRMRKQDWIGRYGGEEFLLILPETGLEGAMRVAEDLRADIEREPIWFGETPIPVTASIGVWGGTLIGTDTADALVDRSDKALYQAKHAGRNTVRAAQ